MLKYLSVNENWVLAYDPKTEPRPNTPMNHPAAISAERKIVVLNESMHDKIKDHPYKGKEKDELLDVIKRWHRPPFEKIENIMAAIGAAGTGKSTALNLVLNAELSRTVSHSLVSATTSYLTASRVAQHVAVPTLTSASGEWSLANG